MIHISLSPNLEPDDVFLALRWLSSPFSWTGKKNQEKLKESLQQLFPQTQAIFLFNAGRSALMLGLKALNLPPGSKILLQAFTCSTVPNAILWNNLTPEYLDIQKEDFNLNPDILPQNPVAKALIVQHTFGQPANMEKITAYCQKKKLYLIEDGAHSVQPDAQPADHPGLIEALLGGHLALQAVDRAVHRKVAVEAVVGAGTVFFDAQLLEGRAGDRRGTVHDLQGHYLAAGAGEFAAVAVVEFQRGERFVGLTADDGHEGVPPAGAFPAPRWVPCPWQVAAA